MHTGFKILLGVVYTLGIIWATLVTIRMDVAQQLNRSYEIRDQHITDLAECNEALGIIYESY